MALTLTLSACGGGGSAPDGAGAAAEESRADDASQSPGFAPLEVRLNGTGYSYALPQEWQDFTSSVADTASPAADTVTGSSEVLQGASALLIVRRTSVEDSPDLRADRAAVRAALREDFNTELDGPITNSPARKIGGEQAFGLTVRLAVRDDVQISATYWVVRVGGTVYQLEAVTRADPAQSTKNFQAIYDSWEWGE
ncbi:hypothetical protein GCM10027020_20070 [Nocardioides salsibiostraticola]